MLESALAVAEFLLLTMLSALVLGRGRSVQNITFSSATMLIAMTGAAGHLFLLSPGERIFRWSVFMESLLPAVLLSFSLAYSRQRLSPAWTAVLAASFFFPYTGLTLDTGHFFYSPDVESERILFLGRQGYWFYLGTMVYIIIALVNIEAAFRSSSGATRWKMKFEVAGIIAAFSVLIFYYSYGLLYRTINMGLMPVRSGVMIIASLLIAYSRFFRGNNVKVVVSRHVLYRSITMVLIGVYLIALWLSGRGMRYLDASLARNFIIFVVFAAGLGLFIAFSSTQVRRAAKVYISKHFYDHKYDYRSEWLKFTERLSSSKTTLDVQDAVISTVKETFGVEAVSLYLLDRNTGKYVLPSSHIQPSAVPEVEVSGGLLAYLRDRDRVLNPLDGEYSLTAEEASFVGQSGARLVVPLVCNAELEGLLVLARQLVREDFIYEDYDLLKNIAKQAALSIVTFSLYEQLAETKQMAAVARISSFVIHDLKNLASALSVTLDNAEEYIEQPEFQAAMVETIRNTNEKMKGLVQKLRAIPEKPALVKEPVDLNALVQETIGDVEETWPGVEFVHRGSHTISMADTEEMKKVVLNLLLNAADSLNGAGVVDVETACSGDRAYISVMDSGCGMSREFLRDQLFKPFKTTKKKGIGIGLYQCKQIVDAHGGRIEVSSRVGEGSTFKVWLPTVAAHASV